MKKIPSSKIPEVQAAIKAATVSARKEIERAEESWKLRDLLYVSYKPAREYSPIGEWRIGLNLEEGMRTLIYVPAEKQWLLREPVNGTDRAISAERAASHAEDMFSGYFG